MRVGDYTKGGICLLIGIVMFFTGISFGGTSPKMGMVLFLIGIVLVIVGVALIERKFVRGVFRYAEL